MCYKSKAICFKIKLLIKFSLLQIDFEGIPAAVEMVMEMHKADFKAEPTLEDIVAVDIWSRDAVDRVLSKVNSKCFINL